MPVPAITLTGTLQDIFGAAVNGGSVVIQLVGFGGVQPRVVGTNLLARTAPLEISVGAPGTFATLIYGNDVIAPGGTYYIIQVLDDQNNVVMANAYQLAGGGTQDLSNLAPYNPNVVVVPGTVSFGALLVLAYAANLVINALLGTAFEVTLTGNVGSTVMNNVQPGTLYTFIIIQDGVGGRTFVWPGNVIGPEAIDPAAGSISVQTFIARANGNLYPVGPQTWS